MSQHDYNIANGGGAAVRADINNALGAIQSLNSGATAPTSTVAGMLWYDTNTGSLKQRNSANTAWVAAAELIAGGGQLAGMRNKIINGKMDVAQRGTSFAGYTSSTTPTVTVDRFSINHAAHAAVYTITQQADAPSGNEFQNSYRLAVTTADASIASGDVASITHRIEGFNVRDLIGRTFTLSFWVRSSKTGVHCVTFINSGTDRSYVAEYTISAANTWEFKTITVSGGLITAGTWNWTNGLGLTVGFTIASGSTFHTISGAWQTGQFYATANQVNCLDTIGNIFAITGVQLEPGAVATPFEHRSMAAELALCQRYYHAGSHGTLVGCYSTNTWMLPRISFPAEMRATPTIVYAAATSGLTGTTPVQNSSDPKGMRATVSTTGTANTLNFIDVTYTASAEL